MLRYQLINAYNNNIYRIFLLDRINQIHTLRFTLPKIRKTIEYFSIVGRYS